MPSALVRATPAERRPWYFCAGLPWDRTETRVEIVDAPEPYKPPADPKIENGAVKKGEEWERPKQIAWAQLHDLRGDDRVQVQILPDKGDSVDRLFQRADLAAAQRDLRRFRDEFVESCRQQGVMKVPDPDRLPVETRPYFKRDCARLLARESELLKALGLPPSACVLHFEDEPERKAA